MCFHKAITWPYGDIALNCAPHLILCHAVGGVNLQLREFDQQEVQFKSL